MKKRLFLIPLASLLLTACQPSISLQRYYVEKTEDADFLVFNLPIQLESFFVDSLEAPAQKTLQSVEKINMLLFKADSSKASKMGQEIERVQKILGQDRYQELMSFQIENRKGGMFMEGKLEAIDEGIFWFAGPEEALVVVRLITNQMNPQELVSLLNSLDYEKLNENLKQQLGPLMEALEIQDTPTLQAI